MKLPTDNTNNSEEQASTQNENNGDAAAVAGSQPGASSSSTGSAENSSNSTSQQSASSNQPGTQEVDFSEFLWMENEEEFDSQVLRELEDEEMINYYYELYEASLNENGTWGPNTANIRVTGPPPPFSNPSTESQEDDPVESLTEGISSRLTMNSRLNPEAAEFVPRAANSMSSPN